MKGFIIYISAFLFAWGCKEVENPALKNPSPAIEKEPKKTSLKQEAKSSTFVWLNNENAVPFLKVYFKKNRERNFTIETRFGNIDIEIFEDTPIHSGNFLYLVKEKKYFDNTAFYRVAPGFLIQGGDSDDDDIQSRRFAIGTYKLPPEFSKKHYHVRGAVAITRNYTNNPEKLSTPFDFYIVLGNKHAEIQLQSIERENNITFTPQARKAYKTIGGTPHLDFEHTVFGRVTSGLDVVEKISQQKADKQEWPLEDIPMKVILNCVF